MEVADGQTGVSEPQLLASFNHAFGKNTLRFRILLIFHSGCRIPGSGLHKNAMKPKNLAFLGGLGIPRLL